MANASAHSRPVGAGQPIRVRVKRFSTYRPIPIATIFLIHGPPIRARQARSADACPPVDKSASLYKYVAGVQESGIFDPANGHSCTPKTY